MQVEFVQLINKRFGGLVLYDVRDAKSVTAALDLLMSDITKIDNVSELGLGVPFITVKGEQK
jgi:hypothetical protein